MKTTRHNRKGFTLAEAMIAVTLLAFAASAVTMPFVAGAASRAEGARRTLAAKLVADRLEQITNTDYDQIFWMYEGWYEFPGLLEDGNGGFLAEADDPTYSDFTRFSKVVPFRVENGMLVRVPWEEFMFSDFSLVTDFCLVTVSVSYDEGSMDVCVGTIIGK